MASTTFTDGTTLSDDGWFNDIDAVVYEQTGVGKTTVASATTPDIFAVTTGRLIDYTGTATATGFVAAVSAGSERVLYCAGAAVFTAGANLLIEGITSGTTITLAAGAIVRVYAITTTQFKMTYSVSGTFTATLVGFSGAPTMTAKYSINNGVCSITLTSNVANTSNSTSFSITGQPACLNTVGKTYIGIRPAVNNNGFVYGIFAIDTSYILLINGATTTATSWTASGNKGIYATTLIYLTMGSDA